MELEELYQEVILEHSSNPLNFKLLKKNKNVFFSHQENELCGDVIDFSAEIVNGKIKNIGWSGNGCAISQSSASVLSELLKAQPVADVKKIIESFENMINSKPFNKTILKDSVLFKGVAKFPMRIKCALLSYMAVKDILVNKSSK